MSTQANTNQFDIGGALKDGLIVFAISVVLFIPICGTILDGYSFNFQLWPPVMLAAGAAAGHIAISLFGGKTERKKSIGFSLAALEEKKTIPLIVLGLALLVLPFVASKYWLTVIILAFIYVLLGLGLNIVVGLAGLLDLGFVAFYAVGAYGYALGFEYLGIGFWWSIPFAAITAACCGAILGFPVLRMHGDYLAIVTLGFGEIIRLVLNNWLEFTGGPNGVRAPAPTLFGLEFTRSARQGGTPFHEYFGMDYNSGARYIFIYLVLFAVVAFTIYAVTRLKKMPIGRAWEALREDEIACRSLGLNHVAIKLSAFAMGASIAGVAGVFFASYQGFVNPSSFTFFESALILAVVVLGGLGSIPGVIIAAVVLTIMPEVLRDFAEYRVLVFGLLMVLMMIWRPRGLIHAKRPVFTRKAVAK